MERTLLDILELGDDKLVTQTAYELLANEVFTTLKGKANTVHTHNATDITEDSTHRFVTDTEKSTWNAKLDKTTFDEAMRQLASGLTWKGTYLNIDAVREALPNPQSGWVVITTEGKNDMYIYEADSVNEWQTLGQVFVPGEATQSQSGLMSASDKKKLDGINMETKVDKTTQVQAGNGLTGGGALSGDITLTVQAENDSIIVGSGGIKVDVVDNLNTSSATKALSAGQGQVIAGMIDAKVNKTAQVIAGDGLQGGGAFNEGNVTLTLVSANDGITVGTDNITLNTANDLSTASGTRPLSANQGKILNENKLGNAFLEAKGDLNTDVAKGIQISKSENTGTNRPTGASTETLAILELGSDAQHFVQLGISQESGKMFVRGSNGTITSATWNNVLLGEKSDATNSSSQETVATSKAVMDALTEAKSAITSALANKLSDEEARAIIQKYK